VDATAESEHRPGQPRSEHDAALLERFDARMQLPIIVSAILPLIVAPESNGWVGVSAAPAGGSPDQTAGRSARRSDFEGTRSWRGRCDYPITYVSSQY
jgi:hypothetical protein